MRACSIFVVVRRPEGRSSAVLGTHPCDRGNLRIPRDLADFAGSAASTGVGNLDGHGSLLIHGLAGNIVVQMLAALSPNYRVLIVGRFPNVLSLTAAVPAAIRPTATGVSHGPTLPGCGLVVGKAGWQTWLLSLPRVRHMPLPPVGVRQDSPARHRRGSGGDEASTPVGDDERAWSPGTGVGSRDG